jgi:hypothetical protein
MQKRAPTVALNEAECAMYELRVEECATNADTVFDVRHAAWLAT